MLISLQALDLMRWESVAPMTLLGNTRTLTLAVIMSGNLQAEGLCLRFPENLPPHPTLTHEAAVQMLSRAVGLATQVAFQPSYIDKPLGADASLHPCLLRPSSNWIIDGQIYLLFIPGGVVFPLDGVRYLEHDQRYSFPIQGGRVRDWWHRLRTHTC